MRHESLILQPVVTEKAVAGEARGIYIFKILQSTNKTEVAKAIEKIFATKVLRVRIVNTKDKSRGAGKRKGVVKGFKKAIVTLEKWKTIKIREEKKAKDKKSKETHADNASHSHSDEEKLSKPLGHARGSQREKSRRKITE